MLFRSHNVFYAHKSQQDREKLATCGGMSLSRCVSDCLPRCVPCCSSCCVPCCSPCAAVCVSSSAAVFLTSCGAPAPAPLSISTDRVWRCACSVAVDDRRKSEEESVDTHSYTQFDVEMTA